MDTVKNGHIFCHKIYPFLGTCTYQISKNQINLDLIEITEFCLNIYDLWKRPHLCVGIWVG